MNHTDKEKKLLLSRRGFLKTLGVASAATAGLTACIGGRKDENSSSSTSDIPTDKMTYRINPISGDKVSLLGFGMMRLPSVSGRSAREGGEDETIDQHMVN